MCECVNVNVWVGGWGTSHGVRVRLSPVHKGFVPPIWRSGWEYGSLMLLLQYSTKLHASEGEAPLARDANLGCFTCEGVGSCDAASEAKQIRGVPPHRFT